MLHVRLWPRVGNLFMGLDLHREASSGSLGISGWAKGHAQHCPAFWVLPPWCGSWVGRTGCPPRVSPAFLAPGMSVRCLMGLKETVGVRRGWEGARAPPGGEADPGGFLASWLRLSTQHDSNRLPQKNSANEGNPATTGVVTVLLTFCALLWANTVLSGAHCSWIIVIHPLILTAPWRPGSTPPIPPPRLLPSSSPLQGRELSLRDVRLPTRSCPALTTDRNSDLPCLESHSFNHCAVLLFLLFWVNFWLVLGN